MEMNTKYFGQLNYAKEELIQFDDGLFGFEEFKKYLLIRFDNDNNFMLCLQNIEDESLSFILINPFYLLPDYAPRVSQEDMDLLDIKEDSDVAFYVISVIKDSLDTSTVNLKCPIIVNTDTSQARQVILDHPDYAFRHPIKQFSIKEG